MVASREPAVALAFCAGNFPQLVRNLQPLLQAAELTALRSPSERPLPVASLLEWAAQTAALLRSHQVDAPSQFDTQYALTENAGAKLRMLDTSAIAKFPSNGFVALEETLKDKRAQAVALTQGYAKGAIFAINNPEAAIHIVWEVFPQTKSTGKDEATALKDDVKTLEARARSWRLEAGGVSKWGENSEANYTAYIAFLVKNGVLKQSVPTNDLITNDLIADINNFDAAAIVKMAKQYKAK